MSTDIEVRFDVIDNIIKVGAKYPKGHDFELACSHEEVWKIVTYCRENDIPVELVAEYEGEYTLSTAGSHRLLTTHELER